MTNEFKVGDKVEFQSDQDGKWYNGTVKKVPGDGELFYHIDIDRSTFPHTVPSGNAVKLPQRVRALNVKTEFKVGEIVEFTSTMNGKNYDAVIEGQAPGTGIFKIRVIDPGYSHEFGFYRFTARAEALRKAEPTGLRTIVDEAEKKGEPLPKYVVGQRVEFKSTITEQWVDAKVEKVPAEDAEYYRLKITDEDYIDAHGVNFRLVDMEREMTIRPVVSPVDTKLEDSYLRYVPIDQDGDVVGEMDPIDTAGLMGVHDDYADAMAAAVSSKKPKGVVFGKVPELAMGYEPRQAGLRSPVKVLSLAETEEYEARISEEKREAAGKSKLPEMKWETMLTREPDFSIGAEIMPGVSKMIEELGELTAVLAKVQAMGQIGTYHDGTDLQEALEDELADVQATITFFRQTSAGMSLDDSRMEQRVVDKIAQYRTWHNEKCAERVTCQWVAKMEDAVK